MIVETTDWKGRVRTASVGQAFSAAVEMSSPSRPGRIEELEHQQTKLTDSVGLLIDILADNGVLERDVVLQLLDNFYKRAKIVD